MRHGLLAALAVCSSAAMLVVSSPCDAADRTGPPTWLKDSTTKLQHELVAKYGAACASRAPSRAAQVAQFWRAEDGDAAAFEAFVARKLRRRPESRATPSSTASSGCWRRSTVTWPSCATSSASRPTWTAGRSCRVDEIFAGYDPAAHVTDDLFANKIAFVVLLNFPLDHAPAAAGRGRALDAAAVGRGAAGRALRHAASRPKSSRPSPRARRTPSCTSASTASACTTCWTPRAGGPSRRSCG